MKIFDWVGLGDSPRAGVTARDNWSELHVSLSASVLFWVMASVGYVGVVLSFR